MENMSVIFAGTHSSGQEDSSVEMDKLYAQIGQLKVENDFF